MPCKVISSITALFHPLTYPTEKGGMNSRPGTSSNACTSQLLHSHHVRVRQEPFRQDKLKELDCHVWFDHAWHAQVAPETASARGWTNQRHLILDGGFNCDRATASRVWWTCFQNFPPPKYWLHHHLNHQRLFSQNFCEKIPPGGVLVFSGPWFLTPPPLAAAFWKFPTPSARPKKRRGSLQLMSFFPRKFGHLKTTNSWECLGLYMGLYYPVIKQPHFFSWESNTLRDHPTGCWPEKHGSPLNVSAMVFPKIEKVWRNLQPAKRWVDPGGVFCMLWRIPTEKPLRKKRVKQTPLRVQWVKKGLTWEIFGCFRK